MALTDRNAPNLLWTDVLPFLRSAPLEELEALAARGCGKAPATVPPPVSSGAAKRTRDEDSYEEPTTRRACIEGSRVDTASFLPSYKRRMREEDDDDDPRRRARAEDDEERTFETCPIKRWRDPRCKRRDREEDEDMEEPRRRPRADDGEKRKFSLGPSKRGRDAMDTSDDDEGLSERRPLYEDDEAVEAAFAKAAAAARSERRRLIAELKTRSKKRVPRYVAVWATTAWAPRADPLHALAFSWTAADGATLDLDRRSLRRPATAVELGVELRPDSEVLRTDCLKRLELIVDDGSAVSAVLEETLRLGPDGRRVDRACGALRLRGFSTRADGATYPFETLPLFLRD